MRLDLNLAPLHRVAGRDLPELPGLIAAASPRGAARGREHAALLVHLILTGSAVVSRSEYSQLAAAAAGPFFRTPGTVTTALRLAAEAVNQRLVERNLAAREQGRFVTGWLTLGVVRETQCTFLICGPVHVFRMGEAGTRHIHEPALSGRGLGLGQSITFHLAQENLSPGDHLVLSGRLPSGWESLLNEAVPAALPAIRRRLLTVTREDLNAVLVETAQGTGRLHVMTAVGRTGAEPTPEPRDVVSPPAPQAQEHLPSTDRQSAAEYASPPAPADEREVQPSAYAIPAEAPDLAPPAQAATVSASGFPASIPRLDSPGDLAQPTFRPEPVVAPPVESTTPKPSSEGLRRAARRVTAAIQAWRNLTGRLGDGLSRFLPRLLPGTDPAAVAAFPGPVMTAVALLVPVVVVLIASTVYLRYGRSIQYETYLTEAQEARQLALIMTGPPEQRAAWEAVLLNVANAETYRRTSETQSLRGEAESNLDRLLGILRLQFTPAFSSDLGIQISRMSASDNDLFLLDAESGEVNHARVTSGRRFEYDMAFNCAPGVYGGYTVGPIVDILVLPGVSSLEVTALGVDAAGNLLYCTPGKVAQAIPLPPPDTNWGRVTAMTMDAGNLYVLDAPARAVWVYAGKNGTFIDRPYFFFGGQTPEKQDVIDLAVSGDDLYLLHADGHLSTCSYSRIETVPTRCEDPAPYINPFEAAFGADSQSEVFATTHFTQMSFSAAPDQSILLLDADSQGVFRLAARSLELQNQLRPTTGPSNPVPQGPVGAMAVSPNHVLFLAIKGQVYFASGLP